MRKPVLVAAGTALVLGVALAADRPLSFPDFPLFADRARDLSHGTLARLADPLYPVGYPLILAGTKAIVRDGLVAGRLLSAIAAVALAGVVAEAGDLAAFALLACAGFASSGATEGTDMPAAALGIAAILLAERRPGLAGALAGAAALTRYPAAAAIPVVLGLSRDRRAAIGPAAAIVIHLAAAALAGGPYLPDQSHNLAIGGAGSLLLRWPVASAHAAFLALSDPIAAVAAIAVVLGRGWRDRRVVGLLAAAILHVGLLGLAFANPRLVLPASLAVAVAGGLTLDRLEWRYKAYTWAMLFVGLAGLAALVSSRGPTAREASRDAIVALARPEPLATSSPDVAVPVQGWPLPCRSIVEAEPGDPETLWVWMVREGFSQVLLEDDRVRHQWKGLRPLLSADPPGFRLVAERDGWRLLDVEIRDVSLPPR